MHHYEKKSMLQTDYRISFAIRNDTEHNLIWERVIEEGIKDINELSRKYSLILKKFYSQNPEDMFVTTGCKYYVEIYEVNEEVTRKISFATVLRDSASRQQKKK